MRGGRPPTAAQKRWHSWLIDKGCVICGGPAELHHPVGSTARHKGEWIGQDFVIALAYQYHRHGPFSRHGSPKGFASLVPGAITALDAEKKLFYGPACEYGIDPYLIELIMDYK